MKNPVKNLFQIRPARPQEVRDVRVIADLDRLVSEPIGFRYQGQVHLIKEISTANFMALVNQMAKLDMLRTKPDLKEEELYQEYETMFRLACYSITREMIESMKPSQMAALLQQIIDCITGRAYKDENEKKKTPQPA